MAPEIEEKYQKAVESYNYMLTIAFDAEKWLTWMTENFEEKDYADNLECKIGEHWFMKDIWKFYINFLKRTDPKVSRHASTDYSQTNNFRQL